MERRKPERLKFYNSARLKIGKQGIRNRIDLIFKEIDFDRSPFISDDNLRINLKKTFKMTKN